MTSDPKTSVIFYLYFPIAHLNIHNGWECDSREFAIGKNFQPTLSRCDNPAM